MSDEVAAAAKRTILGGLSLRHKAALFPTIALISFGAILLTAPYFIGKNAENLTRIQEAYLPTLETSRDLEETLTQMQRDLQDAAASQDAAALEATSETRDNFNRLLGELAGFGLRDRAAVDALRASFVEYYRIARATTADLVSGQMSDATVRNLDQMRQRYVSIRDELRSATRQDRAQMQQAFVIAGSSNQKSLYAYSVITGVMIVLIALLSVWIGRSVTTQLSHLTVGFERLSSGDFSNPIPIESTDELGELTERANQMAVELRRLFRTVALTSGDVAAAAAGMFSAARQQEAITTQQNAAIEEVGRTIEALSSSSEAVNASASEVRDMAAQSLDSSRRLAEHTRLVSEHSERIGQILQLIQDIANKSDLLALNAALEGTKAGEAGRAFSLVAAEMRRLSEHVMDSVRDIRKLVADTRDASHSSVTATTESIDVAEKTAEAAASISRAAEEQRSGTEQVRQAADDIVVGVREVLVSAAESSRSAEGLLQLSQQLKSALEAFTFEVAQDADNDG